MSFDGRQEHGRTEGSDGIVARRYSRQMLRSGLMRQIATLIALLVLRTEMTDTCHLAHAG